MISSRCGLLAALDTEWLTLGSRLRSRRVLVHWATSDARFATVSSLAEVVDRVRDADKNESICWCQMLLRLVGEGDELARRTVLQAFLRSIAGELAWWRSGDRHSLQGGREAVAADLEEIVLAAAIQAIHQLGGREPRWPILDHRRLMHRLILQAIRRQEAWDKHATLTSEFNDCLVDDASDVGLELLYTLREVVALGRISAEAAQAVWQTRSGGITTQEMADRLGVTVDAFRRRRHRTEAVLAGAMRAAA